MASFFDASCQLRLVCSDVLVDITDNKLMKKQRERIKLSDQSASHDSIYSPTKSANTDTMARGKQTCKILKEIRRQIAEANGIEFATSECRYKGDCLGTCPKCEAEVRYLEQQLRARSLSGKAIALAGISTGMILMSGCSGTSTSSSNINEMEGVVIYTEEVEDTVEESEVREIWLESQVDVKPEFPGGDDEMRNFFDECWRKEKDAIIGSAKISYTVNFKGEIENPEIIEGDTLLGKQLIRIINQFPNHTPGKRNGKPVDVYKTFSFSLSLQIGVDTIK